MIVSLRGTVAQVGLDRVVVEVGGVGLLAHVTPATAAGLRVGQPAALRTSLTVREDAWTLYGFATDDEKSVFETVQTVSGIGPRLALALLAVLTPDDARRAIAAGDIATLVKVPGIGKRSAERMIVELRDRVGVVAAPAGVPVGDGRAAGPALPAPDRAQVKDALVGLGWSAKQAEDAVTAAVAQAAPEATVAQLLRAALRELGK